MNRYGQGADVAQMGVAISAGLIALIAPPVAAVLLVTGFLQAFVTDRQTDRLTLTPLLTLTAIAVAGACFGAPGAVGAALVWRAILEVGRSRETQGLSEPLWLAVAYRWAPVSAALLFRLNAPAALTIVVGCVAGVALTDWAMRRLAEWRLGEPQTFDTMAYLGSQARVLALIVFIPDAFASLAAFATLTLARAFERTSAAPRYAAAL